MPRLPCLGKVSFVESSGIFFLEIFILFLFFFFMVRLRLSRLPCTAAVSIFGSSFVIAPREPSDGHGRASLRGRFVVVWCVVLGPISLLAWLCVGTSDIMRREEDSTSTVDVMRGSLVWLLFDYLSAFPQGGRLLVSHPKPTSKPKAKATPSQQHVPYCCSSSTQACV